MHVPDQVHACNSYGGDHGLPAGSTGGGGPGGRPLFPSVSGTWSERLMATYERRIWVGALIPEYFNSEPPLSSSGTPGRILMSSAAIPLAQMGFRKISELAGVAGAREPCSEIRGRGKCLGLGCTYDTSRGCKVRTGGSSAILDLSGAKMDMGSQPKASAETTSRRAGAKGGKEEGGRAAAGAAKREEGGGLYHAKPVRCRGGQTARPTRSACTTLRWGATLKSRRRMQIRIPWPSL